MKKYIYIVIITGFFSINASSAYSQAMAIEEAEMLFEGGEYQSALNYFQNIISQNKKPQSDWIYKVAECYRNLKDYYKADEYYAKLVDNKEVPVEMYLNYGHVLRYLKKHNEAKAMYEKYNALKPGHPNIQNYIQSCTFALQNNTPNPDYASNPVNLKIDGLHFGAARYKNGLLYSVPHPFTDSKTQITYPNYKLYFSEFDGNAFAEGKPFDKAFESILYLGSPAVSADNKTILFTRSATDTKMASKQQFKKKGISAEGIITLNIFQSEQNGNSWSNPVSININSAEYSCLHPCLSSNGQKLYFVSNKPGGKGGYDLYVSTRSGNTWSSPQSVFELNTPDNEMYPYVVNDTVLYFSSNGHVGFGGSDIYVSYYRNGKWSSPVNMGLGINSERDDFGLFWWEGRKGFFASNRNTDGNKDEFFSFEKVIHYKKGKGTVIDELTLAKMGDVTIEVYDEDGNLVGTVVTDKNGKYDFSQFDPDKKYHIVAKKKGYKDFELDVDPNTTDLNNLAIKMEPIVEKNVVFTFNDILFEFGKADLLPESKEILDRLADLLLKNPRASVELSAHTDSRGSDQANMTLSQKRAESSVNYLISKGVKKEQLVAKGYGESQLKNKCKNGVTCTEEEHAVNRRVEIKVLDVK
jgi:outer membrane protein OmpA-like peptidoglycan-associated protein/tetratricopeptide (TPR) repeat protein